MALDFLERKELDMQRGNESEERLDEQNSREGEAPGGSQHAYIAVSKT